MRMADVDLKVRTFMFRDSKARTRIVPFGADLARALERYLPKRAALVCSGQLSDHLLLDCPGRALRMRSVTKTICRLFRRVGLKPEHGPSGPCAYDFRHNVGGRGIPPSETTASFFPSNSAHATPAWRNNQRPFRNAMTRSVGR
jgi:integrase